VNEAVKKEAASQTLVVPPAKAPLPWAWLAVGVIAVVVIVGSFVWHRSRKAAAVLLAALTLPSAGRADEGAYCGLFCVHAAADGKTGTPQGYVGSHRPGGESGRLLSCVAHDPDTPPAVATDLEPLVFQRVSVAKFLVLRRAMLSATRRATQKPIPTGRFDAAPHVAANEVFPIHFSPLIGTQRRASAPCDGAWQYARTEYQSEGRTIGRARLRKIEESCHSDIFLIDSRLGGGAKLVRV
jgi:hypothetical protein